MAHDLYKKLHTILASKASTFNMQEIGLKILVINIVILLCRLQLQTKVWYRVTQFRENTTYSQIGSINIEIKGPEKKPSRAKTEAEHNNYFSFSKAYCCSVPRIHGFYYCNKFNIGRAT